MDLNLRRTIEAGLKPGPDMDVTGPDIGGPSSAVPAIPYVANAQQAADITRFWASQGVTSFKVYEDITRDELKAVLREAHARRLKVTGHLCSVTPRFVLMPILFNSSPIHFQSSALTTLPLGGVRRGAC